MIRYILITAAVVICASVEFARADWVSLSGAENSRNIAEIHIGVDHVRVELEIFVQDLVAFDPLLPDEFFEGSDITRSPLAERMRTFSHEGLQVITDDGRKLLADLKIAEPRRREERPSTFAGKINPYTLQTIPGPPEDKRVLYVELIYPFDAKPASLTFISPSVQGGRPSVSIGFITYHLGVPLIDFRYLPGSSTVHLDWDDPWYSVFEEKGLKRWQRGSVTSFLYIEPFEVRHEILARVKDVMAWVDLDLRGEDFIEADENDALKQRVGEFFLKEENLLINGEKLKPILDRTAFVKYSMTGSTFLSVPERLPVNTAMVGVIITYLTTEMPDSVSYTWGLWSDRIQKVPTDAIDPAGGLPSYMTPDYDMTTWTNFLKTYEPPTVVGIEVDETFSKWKVPIASLLCLMALLPVGVQLRKRRSERAAVAVLSGVLVLLVAGVVVFYPYLRVAVAKPAAMAPPVSDEYGRAIFGTLIRNVYRSFDFREEEIVYDKLATSVHGDLLTDIYLQNRKSLVVARAGGAQARVKDVEILDASVTPIGGLGLECHAKWTALGTVGHWGHIHTRKNRYEADIIIEPVDGAWKITSLEVLEEERIDP